LLRANTGDPVHRQLRTGKVLRVSSVRERLGAAAPARSVNRTRFLIAGIVAFAAVLGFWVWYAQRHPLGYTLFPVDLGVYRDGGLIVRHISPPYDGKLANPLYDWPLNNESLKFTYTPFAGLVFAVVSFVPWSILPRVSQLVNLAALLVATWCTMSALGYRDRRVLAGGALLGAAAGLLTEPVFRTMYLGQINLILMALIIWDLRQQDSRWWMGIATGFAAGVKLVPLIFIPYLLLTRKFRQAAVATGAFVGTVLLGFVILPGDSKDWWVNGLFIHDGRTGFVGWGGNQSLRAITTRLGGSIDAGTVPWVIAAVIVTVGGLLCAARLYRAGHPMLGILTTALVGLLDSPISWDHHWVWVVPGMMAAAHYAVRGWRAGRWGRAAGCSALAGGMFLVFVAWPGILWSVLTKGPGNFTHGLIWAAPNTPVTRYVVLGDRPWFLEYHWRGLQNLAGNAYVLSGLLLLVILGFTALTAAPLASAPAGPAVAAQAAAGDAGPGEPAAADNAGQAGQGIVGEDDAGPAEPAASDPARA
jgi:alpha-1,2-mannosyltransferase